MQHFSNINKGFISWLICIIFQMNPLMHSAFFFFSFNKVMIRAQARDVAFQLRRGRQGKKRGGICKNPKLICHQSDSAV